jgi:hypothetical protein
MEPFNLAAHEALLAAGYSYEQFEECWEDDGDPENGPSLSGHSAFDWYGHSDGHEVFVGADGDTGNSYSEPDVVRTTD